MQATGRSACVINLDPANDALPYTAAVDVADLVHLDAVMEELHLGPNGGGCLGWAWVGCWGKVGGVDGCARIGG